MFTTSSNLKKERFFAYGSFNKNGQRKYTCRKLQISTLQLCDHSRSRAGSTITPRQQTRSESRIGHPVTNDARIFTAVSTFGGHPKTYRR